MERKILYLLLLCLGCFSASAQVMLHSESFETDGEGVRYNSNTYSYCPTDPDYFLRTNTNPVLPGGCAAGFGSTLTNLQGTFFWAGEDIMSNQLPFPGNHAPGQITTQNINIASYATLTVSLYLATASNNATRWENADSINIQAKIDGGAYRTVGRFMGSAPGGGRLRIDGNLDGAITGADPLTNCDTVAFTKYTFSIPGGGTTLNIRLDFDQFGGTEESAIDLIEVKGILQTCTAPTITCPGAQTLALDANCQATMPSYTSLGNVSGNCAPTVSQTPAIGSIQSGSGPLTVTLTATNTALQTGNCSFTVNKTDAIAPSITCPPNQGYSTDPGNCSAVLNYVTPAGTDNCSGATTALIAGYASGAAAPPGSTTIIYRVTDAAGNSATCSFFVNVTDQENPTIICPPNITAFTDPNSCFGTVNYNMPTGADNCGISQITIGNGLPSGSTFFHGPTPMTLIASDLSSNVGSCSFIITVVDNQSPVAICQDITAYLDGSGMATISASQIDNGSTDNCQVDSLSLDISTFSCFQIGSNTVNLTVADADNNLSFCAAMVTVLDTIPPSAQCRPFTLALDNTGNATLLSNLVDFGSTDNCTVANLLVSPSTFNLSDLGANSVVLTALDPSGNSDTCTAIVTVTDTAVGISDPLLGQILFTLSPNPAQDLIQVQVECKICVEGDDIALQLWSLNGQLLRSLPISADVRRQVIALDLSGLAASSYMLRLLHNGRAISRQVIKL